MRGGNDRNFLNLWQMVYRATCPGLDLARWRVDGVEWRKERHSVASDRYSFACEVYFLEPHDRAAAPRRLMVVSEHWWEEDRKAIKSTIWARMLAGEAQAALRWAAGAEKRLRRDQNAD